MLAIGHKRSKCCCSIAVEEDGWARRRSGKVRPPRIFFDATSKGPRDNNHNHNLILKIGHSTRAALRQSPEARLCLFTRMSAWLEPPRGRHSAMGASRVSATSLLALLEYLQSPLCVFEGGLRNFIHQHPLIRISYSSSGSNGTQSHLHNSQHEPPANKTVAVAGGQAHYILDSIGHRQINTTVLHMLHGEWLSTAAED